MCSSDLASAVRGTTFGYRYLLPVHAAYRASADEGTDRLRYSFFSRSETDLVVGEYAAGDATRRLASVALDPGSLLPRDDPQVLGDGPGHMQGAVRVDDSWYATTSHGRARLGSVWTGSPGSSGHWRQHRWATPMGPEDLTHDPATDELWSVTEHPWARWVCAMKRSWYD